MAKEKITCIHDQMVEVIDPVESRDGTISSESVSNGRTCICNTLFNQLLLKKLVVNRKVVCEIIILFK